VYFYILLMSANQQMLRSQYKSAYTFTHYPFKIHFNNILLSTPAIHVVFLFQDHRTKVCTNFSLFLFVPPHKEYTYI
jgi:hypothetical protein